MPVRQIDNLVPLPTRVFDPEVDLQYTPLMDTGEGNGFAVPIAAFPSGFPLHLVYIKNATADEATLTIKIVGSLEIDSYYGVGQSGLRDEVVILPPRSLREWRPYGIFTQQTGDNIGNIIIECDQLIEIAPVHVWTTSL